MSVTRRRCEEADDVSVHAGIYRISQFRQDTPEEPVQSDWARTPEKITYGSELDRTAPRGEEIFRTKVP
jgi:hypothetical protein